MKITISEARRTLPELVKRVRGDDLRVFITVHGEVAAELRPAMPEPAPGAAATRLREVMARLPAEPGPRRHTSERVGEALYGEEPE